MKVDGKKLAWLKLTRTSATAYERQMAEAEVLHCSERVAQTLSPRLGAEVGEVMVVVLLDGRNRMIGLAEVARGGLHGCAVSARDILRIAIAGGASAFVLAHNHPSGDPTPSSEDVTMTEKVVEAAQIVGVPCVDHVIVAGTRHKSMLNLGIGGFS